MQRVALVGDAGKPMGKHGDSRANTTTTNIMITMTERVKHYLEKFNNENVLNIHLHIFDRIFA